MPGTGSSLTASLASGYGGERPVVSPNNNGSISILSF